MRLGLSNFPLRAVLALLVLSLATLPPFTGASHNDEEPAPIAPFVVVANDLGAPRGIVHHEGDRVLVATGTGELWSLNATHREPAGSIPLDAASSVDVANIDRDASGALVVDAWKGALHVADGAAEPIVPFHGGQFGPDGRLYFVEYEKRGDDSVPVLLAVDGMRRVERIMELPQYVHDAAFAPDGRLFVREWSNGHVYRVDLVARSWEDLGFVGGGADDMAVDSLGRLYVANGHYRVVERFDFAAGEHVLLGEGVSGAEPRIAFAGTRLWATTGPEGWTAPPTPNVVGYYETGVEGFPGFHPTFDLAPLPNLVLERVEERLLDETGDRRELVLSLTNDGGSWMGGGWVAIASGASYQDGMGVCVRLAPTVEGCGERRIGAAAYANAMAPGGTVELVIPWDARHAMGAQHVFIEVNRAVAPFESTHDDNVAEFRTYVKVDTPIGGL